MRDTELMVELLRDMSNNNGRTTVTLDGFDQRGLNHLDLLVDAGRAEWIRRGHTIRITKDGYDFLDAIGNEK